MDRTVLLGIIDSLRKGQVPAVSEQDFPCFSPQETEGNPWLSPAVLQRLARSWNADDIPTFERAVRAIDEGELGWLGFKVVYDADAAVRNVDNEVTKKYGEEGSADGLDAVFFCSDAKELASARTPSARDRFQMKDATRGPSMHTEQFDGLTWCSVPLQDKVRVWLLGASDSAAEVAALAAHVGFDVVAVDYDAAYLNEQRFPGVQRLLIDSFDDMEDLPARTGDYVCVLTRGHMYDPQGCVWATRIGAHYIGMMGCAGKNQKVHGLCLERGMTEEQWQAIKRPIGLKFGAVTPAELAIAIVAELVDVRYQQRYSKEARDKHDADLGR